MIDKVKYFLESHIFGVCDWWGRRLGIKASRVRLAFIYVSFIALGSPLLVYLIMAFILENKEYFKHAHRRTTVWEIED
ncbi:MAG: PspC domain-containing protein [Flavobacteriales bacterium]|nr:PspC domain-containing protein [Flavobacteriales bacterium]